MAPRKDNRKTDDGTHGRRRNAPERQAGQPPSQKKKLSDSMVDYIEAIDLLTRRHGHAHTKEIAELMQVKMPSVTTALRQLSSKGMIVYNANRPVELTPDGQGVANRIARRHHTMELFLQRALGLSNEDAHLVSCSIDHIIDDDVMRRFLVFYDALENRTDSRRLSTHLTEAIDFINSDPENTYVSLSSLGSGARGVYVKASRLLTPEEERRVRGEFGLEPGVGLSSGGLTLDKAFYTVKTDTREMRSSIPVEIAENLWVRIKKEDEP